MLLSVDIGSSAIKSSLIRMDGQIVLTSRVDLPVSVKGDLAEIDLLDLWKVTVRSVHQLRLENGEIARIEGIGITSQMAGMVFLDRNNQPLTHMVLGIDRRGERFVSDMAAMIGKKEVYRRTGCPLSPIYPAAKLLWFQNNRPDVIPKIWRIAGIKESIIWKLTGHWVTDPATASSTQFYDQTEADWWTDLLALLGMKREMLPSIKNPDEVAGGLLAEAAGELQLASGIPVSVGTGDGPAANLSTGSVNGQQLCISLGTTAVTRFFTDERFDPELKTRFFRQHFARNLYLQGYRMDGAGETIKQILSENVESHGRLDNNNRLNDVLERISFELYDAMQPILAKHLFREIRPVGGGSVNHQWMQDIADLFQLPVVITNAKDSALGAAILAAKATALYPTLSEAVSKMVQISEVLEPDSENGQKIRRRYEDSDSFDSI